VLTINTVKWFFGLFDCVVRLFVVSNGTQDKIKDRLEREFKIYNGLASDQTDLSDQQREFEKRDLERQTKLLEVNHQRVSASISHVSIMAGLMLFSFKTLFECNPISQISVEIELCLYLCIIMTLLRCLRDFGLEEDYTSAKKYRLDLMRELSFRYGILRVCNFTLVSGTTFFLFLFVFHLMPAQLQKSMHDAVLYPLPRSWQAWLWDTLLTPRAASCAVKQ
jgi:hypothetical protein